MKIVKSSVHMSRIKESRTTQITLDDDFILQDTKPDIVEIISKKTEILIDSVKVLEGKVVIRGKMPYHILYLAEKQQGIYSMDGDIPIDEIINIDGVMEDNQVTIENNMEDVNISIINSRKINVRGIVSFTAGSEEVYEEDAIVDLEDAGGVQYIKKPVEVMKTIINKKDVCRIKEEMEIPSNKPNIGRMLWHCMTPGNVQMKIMDDRMSVKGDVNIFIMYAPQEEDSPIQWMENTVHFHGNVEMPGVEEGMTPNIIYNFTGATPEVYKDYDGENRLIRIDAALEMDIKVYDEDKIDIITDVYATDRKIIMKEKEAHFERMVAHNESHCRVSERFSADGGESRIMQICNVSGMVKVDDTECDKDELTISGVVEGDVIYMSSDDMMPVKSKKIIIPFEHNAEAIGLNETSHYFVRPSLEQISANMVSGDEIEIKAVIAADILVIQPVEEKIISDISEEELDMEMIKGMPGIVVHNVNDDETLWTIAKKFYTTVDNIKEINGLQNESIHKGDKLVLVKQVAIDSSI